MDNSSAHLLDPGGDMDPKGIDLPWQDAPSIYDHIVRNIDPETGKLHREGLHLPDEDRRFPAGRLRWIPGALEGALGSRIDPEQALEIAKDVGRHVVRIAIENSSSAKSALYQILVEDDVLGFIDEALMEITTAVVRRTAELREFALSLARTAPDRGPVKFAIALLGLMGNPADVELVSFLGKHEEFTFYSVVALSNILEDPEKEFWKLAKTVDGWGRIHLVQRLASTQSPEIKDWLLREGYRNQVMYEYLAYPCAVGGDLRSALAKETVDDELLIAAGEIINALIVGGPAKDITDYPDAADVILRYLELLDARASSVHQYLITDSLLGYLTEDWDTKGGLANGWNTEDRDRAIILANQILEKPCWRPLVREQLNSGEPRAFHDALRAAAELGIETWDLHIERLRENPLQDYHWYWLMEKADGKRIEIIIDLAMRLLSINEIGTDTSSDLGQRLHPRPHDCLSAIVQSLGRFPGKGWPLIDAGLRSPVTRNRYMAVKALSEWGRSHWSEETEPALRAAFERETDEELRHRIEVLLQGGEIED